MGVYIIAEAGVNHNGDINLAYRLCDQAKRAGVDAVKFQTWKTENIVTKSAPLATYQEANISSKNDTQFEMLKKLELSYAEFVDIQKYCSSIGVNFLSTPDDDESLEFLSRLNLDFIKVGSGEVNNIPYLRKIGSKRQSVVLSTGMSNIGDVERAYNLLLESGASKVALLHCTSNYPCPMDEVNLKAMQTLRTAFNCEVGYSDHTIGIEVPIAAVAMGATIIEKHFTLDKGMEGPDHKASLDPVELREMVAAIRNIELALGDGIKKPNKSEAAIQRVVQKSIVASRTIAKGELLSEQNLTVKRTSNGIPAHMWDMVIGSRSAKEYSTDEVISITQNQ
ncbi:MAG TPA: N-acetylneuraminate synthase [Flavobacterium sp.]|jgi:N-acetylneuraminate synthase/N,N'-diacetyllegionaminate synthase